MREELLDILVCPLCKSHLHYAKEDGILICRVDKLAYPVEDDIPVMLEAKATRLSIEQLEKYD